MTPVLPPPEPEREAEGTVGGEVPFAEKGKMRFSGLKIREI